MKLGNTSVYDAAFYEAQAPGSTRSARVVAPLVLSKFHVRSLVDVGCGLGTWAAVFQELGVKDVWGVDGEYVDRDRLQISSDRFIPADLAKPLILDRRFDLAICLEVAEHLNAEAAPTLVESLSRLADVILFSAAQPGQDGTQHVHEQWPTYWATLFDSYGYSPIDCIRPLIWEHPDVDWWYAQNIILYVARRVIQANPDLLKQLPVAGHIHPGSPAALPNFLRLFDKHDWNPGVTWCARALYRAFRRSLHRRTSRLLCRS